MKQMAPLFLPRQKLATPIFHAIEERLGEYFSAGALGSTDVHVVARLLARVWPDIQARGGTVTPAVALALALAVRAPSHAHICVDLSQVRNDEFQDERGPRTDSTSGMLAALPEDRAEWIRSVSSVAELVRGPGESRSTPFVLDDTWLYTDRYWRYQASIVERVADWTPLPPTPWSGELLAGLDHLFRPPGDVQSAPVGIHRQRLAAAMALRNRLTVITGGPGMGKTWTVRNLLALLCIAHLDAGHDEPPLVALAAPTGKAAVRIRESLLDGFEREFLPALTTFLAPERVEQIAEFITGVRALTLHRLLGVRRDNTSRFRHHRDAPLAFDAVIVDEVSMVDFRMMAKLMDAIGERQGHATRLILLGDRDQLASVEAGTVLADLCGPTSASKVSLSREFVSALPPIVGLGISDAQGPGPELEYAEEGMQDRLVQFNQTYRFSADSGIKRFADACVSSPIDVSGALDALADNGSSDTALLEYGPQGMPTEVMATIVDEFTPYLRLLHTDWQADPARFPSAEVYHRRLLECFDTFRLLCAFRQGRTGVRGMNERVIAALARHEDSEVCLRPNGDFWVGRPIMVTRNEYSIGRYNGDIGIVVERADHQGRPRLFVAFPGQDGLPSEHRLAQEDRSLVEEDYSNKQLVEYLQVSRLPEHETVFAMTIHKSQGSQFGHVMVILPDQNTPSPILTRELIYTGVTRAQRRVTVVSRRAQLARILGTPVRRASQLGAHLWRRSEFEA